ncbi:Uma2 family endonuclease [Glycomyces sp. NPDC046736]|uniref:Uma2 family endonuclease n=1 Tax=Glycomyces sp. NPDC046736 TaxID=3155615 RepID=UPI0033EBE46D
MVMALARETNDAIDYDGAEREFREQLAFADAMDVPGHNVEVFGGNIVVSPWSRWTYFEPMKSVLRQLETHTPDGFIASDSPFKFIFPSAHGALGPDIYVVDPKIAVNDTPFAPSESLALVGELTSTSTRGNDLTIKLDIYGRSVPVYLLFDMKQQRLTVYSDPSERGYQTHTAVAFGKPVQIPAPFDFSLDTTAFA